LSSFPFLFPHTYKYYKKKIVFLQQLSDKMVKKKDSKGIAVFLREGISFLWGIAKNYIMYWGVTSSIIAEHPLLVNT